MLNQSISVRVRTSARLHMGFLDLHGGFGRRFGSIGLALDQPCMVLDIAHSADFSASGPASHQILADAQHFANKFGLMGAVRIDVTEAMPRHAGLGSGTQCALAIGMAMSELYGLGLTPRQVAEATGRGRRSGIGIGTFEAGGFLVDGGRGADTRVPPILARFDFPQDWKVLLVMDALTAGVHGQQESSAFVELPEFSANMAAHISRLVLMQVLPALVEHDLPIFGRAISEIQGITGDYFAPAQGGTRYSSRRVAEVMLWLEQNGVVCMGQSSWGPTGFAVMDCTHNPDDLLEKLRAKWPGLGFMFCTGRNQGSVVERQALQEKLAPASELS